MGHRACLSVTRLLTWGIFTGTALKIESPFFSLGYLKDTKFYPESKTCFIDMSSIASF